LCNKEKLCPYAPRENSLHGNKAGKIGEWRGSMQKNIKREALSFPKRILQDEGIVTKRREKPGIRVV